MPEVTSWEHRTTAVVGSGTWEEAWHSLVSWRGYLQSLPGFLAMRLAVRGLEGGDVEVHVDTLWEHREHLERWLQGPFLPRRIFAELTSAGRVTTDVVLQGLT